MSDILLFGTFLSGFPAGFSTILPHTWAAPSKGAAIVTLWFECSVTRGDTHEYTSRYLLSSFPLAFFIFNMEKPRTGPSEQVCLPAGFRFHPTDEELVVSYLIHKAEGRPFPIPIIAEVDLYKFDPWELPEKALFGEREWYFFSPRDRKYPNGARPNRAAASGYWKATGTDKPIQSKNRKVGVKKALVFYKGKAPKGLKTNWIMHEYRLAESRTPLLPARKKGSLRLDDWVLCRIYKKSTGAYKVMMSSTPKGNAAKPEPEEELDEVLASLPDIDTDNNHHKFKMPPQFAGPTGGGGAGNGNMNSFFPGMDQMFTDEEHENSENTTQQQAMSLSYHHPSSSLTNASYEDYYNSSIYNGPMVMMNKVNSWAYDGQTGTTGQQHYQNDVSMNRVINPPPIKLEKVPSNISDILLQIQQQNCSSRKRKVEDEDDVQSTCRSPVPRTRQGFTFDFHHMV